MNRVEKAIRWIPCTKCGAKPGQRCRTRSGNRYGGSWFVHESRVRPFVQEWQAGFEFGRRLFSKRAERRKAS